VWKKVDLVMFACLLVLVFLFFFTSVKVIDPEEDIRSTHQECLLPGKGHGARVLEPDHFPVSRSNQREVRLGGDDVEESVSVNIVPSPKVVKVVGLINGDLVLSLVGNIKDQDLSRAGPWDQKASSGQQEVRAKDLGWHDVGLIGPDDVSGNILRLDRGDGREFAGNVGNKVKRTWIKRERKVKKERKGKERKGKGRKDQPGATPKLVMKRAFFPWYSSILVKAEKGDSKYPRLR
jgi:hypothetical protein